MRHFIQTGSIQQTSSVSIYSIRTWGKILPPPWLCHLKATVTKQLKPPFLVCCWGRARLSINNLCWLRFSLIFAVERPNLPLPQHWLHGHRPGHDLHGHHPGQWSSSPPCTMHLSHPHRTAGVEENCSWFHCSPTPADDPRRPVLQPFVEDVFHRKNV